MLELPFCSRSNKGPHLLCLPPLASTLPVVLLFSSLLHSALTLSPVTAVVTVICCVCLSAVPLYVYARSPPTQLCLLFSQLNTSRHLPFHTVPLLCPLPHTFSLRPYLSTFLSHKLISSRHYGPSPCLATHPHPTHSPLESAPVPGPQGPQGPQEALEPIGRPTYYCTAIPMC